MGEFVLFADDTNIFVTGKDEKSAYLKANIVLEKVHEYMYSNQLHINTEKSCYMHIHPSLNSTARLTCARSRPLNCGLQLKIGSEKLKKEPNVNFLGVIIDDELNWEAHIN